MKKTALLLLLVAVTASAETKLVDLGTRRVRVRMEGAGPAVVFEAGFRSTLDSWSPVIPEVAKFARVFAYDRAGLGKSDAVAGERSYVALVRELHELIQHEHVATPFLFVGHSYGGALARVYYALYPQDVRGIVFVDPMNEAFNNADPERAQHEAQQEASLKRATPGVLAEWAYIKEQAHDHYAELAKYGRPDVPLALISASMNRPAAWAKSAVATYGAWILDRSDSLLVVTPDSSHLVMQDQPEVVVSTIRALLFPNPTGPILKASEDGADAALKVFQSELKNYPKGKIGPNILNTVAYNVLRNGKRDDAIKILEQNASAFPMDADTRENLGDLYLAAGDNERALASYRKAVELDPTNESAKRAVEGLGAPPARRP